MPTWTDALRQFIEEADEVGVLVMVSGVVGSNNRRKLDPDGTAPLIHTVRGLGYMLASQRPPDAA